jgi:hypothetical protein
LCSQFLFCLFRSIALVHSFQIYIYLFCFQVSLAANHVLSSASSCKYLHCCI